MMQSIELINNQTGGAGLAEPRPDPLRAGQASGVDPAVVRLYPLANVKTTGVEYASPTGVTALISYVEAAHGPPITIDASTIRASSGSMAGATGIPFLTMRSVGRVPVALLKGYFGHGANPIALPLPAPRGRSDLRELVDHSPDMLVDLIERDYFDVPELGHAAEILGRATSDRAGAALLRLLGHSSPIVREGAIYGLARREQLDHRVRAVLERIAGYDPSEVVRVAAQGALDD